MTNILEYLKEAVKSCPDRIALADDTREYTYAEYDLFAKRVATYIKKLLIHDNMCPIGVVAGRNAHTPVIYMGVLYSGNYYVPIDPELPEEKLAKIIRDSGMKLILTGDKNIRSIDEELYDIVYRDMKDIESAAYEMEEFDELPSTPEGTPIYMIYTSGSTGTPKGVLKTHEAMLDYVEAFVDTFDLKEGEIIGNQTPFFFDASAKDIYTMLKLKATLYIIPTSMFSFPIKLIEYLNERKITTISWVPSALAIIAQLGTFEEILPTSLKNVFFVGEVFPMKQFAKWRNALPELRYVNLYGSSEIAGICCYHEVKRDDDLGDMESLPVGVPLKNCKLLLIGDNGVIDRNETGKIGEIYISSKALAREYYHDEEKTNNSFIVASLDSAGALRYFKTGDMAYYNENGELVFASRKDFQIKHMGHRIELGEIENVANTLEDIENCACVYDEKRKSIVLFCETTREDISGQDIRKLLIDKLSNYMLPKKVIIMQELPHNANGKLDRVALKNSLQKK
ncbi:MAG: amino acid adenylation domain-containing protein [Wujia sp.]